MNKAHRVVWSESRGAFIVAHEFAATSGKRSSTKSVIAQSLAVAALVATSVPALAQTVVLSNGQNYSNAGVVQGTSGSPGIAVYGAKAGSITNTGTVASALTTGETNLLFGVFVGSQGGLSGGITNSGSVSLITGQNIGINIVSASTVANIVNDGTITGTTVSGITASQGSSLGTVSNTGTASLISGGTVGVAIISGATSAGVVNAGTITGGQDGIYVNGTGSRLGSINNTGVGSTISGGVYGVSVEAGSAGPITNQGTITGGVAGIFVTTVGSITSIANLGTASVISGTNTTGQRGNGIAVTGTGTIGSVTNQGTIVGVSNGIFLRNGGASVGSLTNSGLISGGNNAIAVESGAHLGVVNNSGTLSGGDTGLANYGASISSVTNTGTIHGGNQAGIAMSSAGTAGTINNSGVISGGRSGIRLGSGASVASVQNSGSITGTNSNGIQLYQNSTISGGVTNSGLIQGNSHGIVAFTGSIISGGITNSASIAASNSSYGKGIWLSQSTLSGGISNLSTGVISGASQGIYVGSNSTLSGGIKNAGTIASGGNIYYGTGILVASNSTLSGGISNLAGGVVSGASGISVRNATVDSISNAAGGTIAGLYAGVVLETAHLTNGITNAGKITGSTAGLVLYSGTTLAGGVTNSGTLIGTNTQYSTGIGIYSESTVSGGIHNLSGGAITGASGIVVRDGSTVDSITNAAGASINSTSVSNNGNDLTGNAGISVVQSTVTGSIVNAGIISGSERGILISSGNFSSGNPQFPTVVGGVTNSGLITAPSVGVFVAGATVTGSIANSGEITGGVAGLVVIGSTISGGISNIGSSASMSGSLAGLYLAEASVAGGVTNSGFIGTLNNTGEFGIFAEDVSISGGITNLSGGTISSSAGLYMVDNSVVDSITNAAGATISGNAGTSGFGVVLAGNSTVTGQIANSGVITGAAVGLGVENSTVGGGIFNAGTITSVGAGVALSSGAQVSGGLQNTGNIIGGATALLVSNGATLSGGIVNSGAFSGGNTAIAIVSAGTSLSGGISNSGTITGGINGIAVKTSSVVTGGIVNSGLINGGVIGISLGNTGSVAGGLYNSGTVSGGLYSVYVDASSSLGGITIAGNSAKFAGDVYSPNSAVSLTSGSTFTGSNAFNVASFDVASGATLNMGVMASTAGEANGITVTNGVTNEGTLSVGRNTANINGSYTQAASGAFGVGVASKTDHGVLAVSGAANLSPNANIVVNVAGNNTLTNKETIVGVLTSTDLTASTFKVTDNSDLISFTGLIDGNDVDLVTKFNALVLPDVLANKNTNAVGAATVLDQIILTSGGSGPFSGVINDIAKLQTSRQVSNAASQTLPLLSGDVNLATYAAMSQMNQVVQSRVDGNYGMSAGSPYMTDQGAWVKPIGSWANAADQNGAPGFSSTAEGVALGADAAISNAARVGLAFAYANVDVSGNSHDAPNNDRINMYQFMGYGSYALDPRTEVNAQIDGGINSNDGHRNIAFAGTTATSSFNSSDAHFGVGIARALPLSESTIFTPEVRVDYTWISTDDYSEGGAGPLSLNTKSTSFESLLTQINGKLTQKVNDNLTLFGNLGIGYDSMAHSNSSVVAAFSGAPGLSFSTQGVGLSPRALLGGIGIVSTPRGNMPEVSFRYDVQQRDGFADQSLSFKARWAF